MKLRQLFEQTNKTAVAAFGRMNPPTIGHKKLVDKVKSISGDHYVFLSHSQGPKNPDAKPGTKASENKDPLDFVVKSQFAKKFFPDVNVGHQQAKTPIQMMQMLEKLGYTDVVYVAGSDRVAQFEKLFNDYNGKEYNFDSIEVVSAGERDPDAEGAEGMSASKMRAAAAAGDFESFKQGVPDQGSAEKMYNAVRAGMGVKDAVPTENTDLSEQQLNEAFPLIVPALAAAVRMGAPVVSRLLSKEGAKQIAKGVAKNAGKAAVVTGKAVIKNPGKTVAAYGAYTVWDTVNSAIEFLEDIGLDTALVPTVAKVIVQYGIPAAPVLAALYGGKKLYDYIKDSNESEEQAEILSALEKQYGMNSEDVSSNHELDEGSPVADLKKIIASKVYKKEYLMALKMMKQEAISAADAARRFMHVDARTLDTMADKMDI